MSKSSYPGLYDPSDEKLHALLGSASFVIGRSETADLTVLDLNCSRQQFRIIRVEAQHYVEPLSRTNSTHHNGQLSLSLHRNRLHDRHDAGTHGIGKFVPAIDDDRQIRIGPDNCRWAIGLTLADGLCNSEPRRACQEQAGYDRIALQSGRVSFGSVYVDKHIGGVTLLSAPRR